MNKILNYISAGTGFGTKIIILISLIASVITAIYLRNASEQFIPGAQNIADKLLPIKISGHMITDPAGTIRDASIDLGATSAGPQRFPIILDTTTDSLNTSNLPSGIYLTRKYIYTVSDKEVRTVEYAESLNLPKADYTGQFSSFLTYSAAALAVFMLIGMFLAYFLAALFYSFTAWLLSAILRKTVAFDSRMRLSVLCIFAVYLLAFLIKYIGISLSGWTIFILILIAQAVIIKFLPSEK